MALLRNSLIVVIAAAAAAATAAPSGRVTYCCSDDNGRPVCGDALPRACYDRAYREVNEHGMTMRRVAPPLTPEQIAEKAAEEKRRQEEALARRERDRRDNALLQSYVSEKDIDDLRDKAVADIDESIAKAQRQFDAAVKRKRQLDAELAALGKASPPKALSDEIRDNEDIRRNHASVIESKRRDRAAVSARYEEEKRRYIEVRQRKANGNR